MLAQTDDRLIVVGHNVALKATKATTVLDSVQTQMRQGVTTHVRAPYALNRGHGRIQAEQLGSFCTSLLAHHSIIIVKVRPDTSKVASTLAYPAYGLVQC